MLDSIFKKDIFHLLSRTEGLNGSSSVGLVPCSTVSGLME